MNLFLRSDEVEAHKDICGPKAINLAQLQKHGFSIPPFIVLPSSCIIAFTNMPPEQKAVAYTECIKLVDCEHFAVRSAALTEDDSTNSQAGMFKTNTNVMHGDLIEMIIDVIQDASKKLESLEQFSVIIQQYIDPEFSGVTFTRNPLGSREIVLEYASGISANVVNGTIHPQTVSLYWTQKVPNIDVDLPNLSSGIEECKKIEEFFDFPQDIEWCIQDKKWHIVQSRPITSLSAEQYRQSKYIDAHAPKHFNSLEKTELCDIAPRPTPLTLSLLEKIYAKKGPVQNAYKKFGIVYTPEKFLQILGNELFVDKEKELHTLLPIYGYLHSAKPRISRARGMWKTLRNLHALQTFNPIEHVTTTYDTLALLLSKQSESSSITEAVTEFLESYSHIVEANILATKATTLAEKIIPSDTLIVECIDDASLESLPEIQLPDESQQWLGNTLELTDDSHFYGNTRKKTSSIRSDSSAISSELRSALTTAKQAGQLREFGRWLTVKLSNDLRSSIASVEIDPTYRAFATLDEYISEIPSQAILEERKREYDIGNTVTLPVAIYGTYQEKAQKICGVSKGEIIGTLVTEDTIDQSNGPKILWHSSLAPYLTKYFDRIDGIVSHTGGMLSHLAIVARERGIPTIVGVDPEECDIGLGDRVCINGTKGTIEKIITAP